MAKNKNYFRTNDKIKSQQVRIVGEDIDSGVVELSEALSIAKNKGLDLIEIVPNANPPVCKITDFQKFLYEKKQKEKELEKVQRKNTMKLKELRFTYNTGDHDFNFKLKHAKNFLERGDKVKALVFFSGREIQFKDQGRILLLKFIDELKELGKIEEMPRLENKRMWVIINPKK